MFRIGIDDAVELGNALLDAAEFIREECDAPVAVERHENKAVVLPEAIAGENTMLVIDP